MSVDEKLQIRYEYHVSSCEVLGREPLDYETWVEQTLEDAYYSLCCEADGGDVEVEYEELFGVA